MKPRIVFLSINSFSTIPLVRYIVRFLLQKYEIDIVHNRLAVQPLNIEGVREKAIGEFTSAYDFNNQKIAFKLKKYVSVFRHIIAALRSQQTIFTIDYQVLATALVWKKRLGSTSRIIYFQFEMVDPDVLPARGKKKIAVIRDHRHYIDHAFFPEANRLNYFCEMTGMEKENCSIIPNTTSCRETGPADDLIISKIPADAIVFGHIGNVGPDHFIKEYVDAINDLAGTRAFFLFVGHRSPKIEEILGGLTNPNVIIMNEVSHHKLNQVYPALDYGVILYKGVDRNFEFCAPNKLYEYWAYGIPVIAHQLGGLKDVVKPEYMGELSNLAEQMTGVLRQKTNEGKPSKSVVKNFFDTHYSFDCFAGELNKI